MGSRGASLRLGGIAPLTPAVAVADLLEPAFNVHAGLP